MTGTERKVFQKYYPPDFDPSKIPRAKGQKNRQFVQRVMTPYNMQCLTCHEYIYKGKKFNMKRETVEGETYLGLRLFRFYFRCPNCLAEITFKTDLENCDYKEEHGAKRLFEALKVYQDAEKKKEEKEAEDAKDPMKMLEKRTMMSRQEMEALGDLEDLQEVSRLKEGVDVDEFLHISDPHLKQAMRIQKQQEADDKLARELLGIDESGKLAKRIKEEDDEDESNIPTSSMKWKTEKLETLEDKKPVKRNDQKSLLSKMVIVKKAKKEEPPEVKPEPTSSLQGLLGYGSGSDSD